MTDVVVAEGSVKLREGKKWKTRWVVLKKPSPVADCLNLLAFKDRRDSCIVESKKERGKGERERHKERDKQKERLESERERADLFLESVCGLEGGLSLEGCDHVLAIISLTQVLLLGFDSPRSLAEWDEQLRDCLGEVHSFAVWVPAGSRLESGPATLHFRHNAFVLTRHAPPALLAHWHLAELRRYGAVPGGFAFEGGTRSAAGAGVFFLACTEADQICFLFDCFVAGFASPRTFRRAPTLSGKRATATLCVNRTRGTARGFDETNLVNPILHSSTGVTFPIGTAPASPDRQTSSLMAARQTASYTPPSSSSRHVPVPTPAASRQRGSRSPLLHRASAVITDKSRLPTKPHLPSPVTEPSRRISSDSGITTVTRSGSGSASGSFSSCSGSAGGSASDEFESLSIPAKGPEASSTIPPAFHQGAEKSECRFPYVTNWWYAVPRRELHSNCPSTCLYKERHSQQEAGKSAPLRTSDTAQRMDAATAAEPPSGQLSRWLEVLQDYQFTTTYRKGLRHTNADCLSRLLPCDECACLSGSARCKPTLAGEMGALAATAGAPNRREPAECLAESTSIVSALALSTPDHTYVNMPQTPTSRHQLNYMELDLQARRNLRGSPVNYAQIDRAAMDIARKVGTQHAKRREGRLPHKQKDAP
ncbi:unnamed protein product [Lampetra planeri]